MQRRKTLMEIKKRKKTFIFISLVLVVAVILVVTAIKARESSSAGSVPYTVLSRTELVNSISVSGMVESVNAKNVYSTLTYPVKEIYVNVGDQVAAAGDMLAKLDTASLELDIAQQKTRMLNNNGLNLELVNAEAALKTAEIDLQTKMTTYENNKIFFEAGYISEQELSQSETNYMLAVTTYDKAVSSLKATKIKAEQENDSQRISLQKLEKNLADSWIKAPIDGTVTAVYAKVGSPGSGLLFVIEDTENLIITTYVKEYDVGQVHQGQMVTIRSDATGDAVLNGEVVKIAPTSTKNAAGAPITSSTVDFETKIAVLDHDTGLKIGMNTRLNIILEKKADVYAVPYDAVTVNADGQSIVYVIADEHGKHIVKELVVETGMETDFYTEVSGEGLSDGVMVVNNATSVKPGDVVNIHTAS
ncbi:MAG: HlyD family efflux transporter periplasmic adaptor subunit [Desulfobacteraceae bacterium]|nr:MAG: HlyD family efflux transporter periplasmic adaptor subunit [Desulfobacteraceae bacterium]